MQSNQLLANKSTWIGQRSVVETGGCLMISLPRSKLRQEIGDDGIEQLTADSTEILCSFEDGEFSAHIPDRLIEDEPEISHSERASQDPGRH